MIENLKRFDLLREAVTAKLEGIEKGESNIQLGSENIGARQVTNVGVFRAYIEAYMENHPAIRKDMTLLVRQLAPIPQGLPIEIYAFTNTIDWIEYEAIQAEIFDHLLAVVPEFNLRVFQNRVGGEFKILPESV